MTARCSIDGCDGYVKARGWCSAHYGRWQRHGDTTNLHELEKDGVGVCECPVSYPDPKCCTVCGFPSVHRMAPAIRDRALSKMPHLGDQILVDRPERRTA